MGEGKYYIPVNLRCEYEKEPLGVQQEKPLFSWNWQAVPPSGGTGACRLRAGGYQTAYQIAAASEKEYLLEGTYDIWDSGKVYSGQCTGISYGGVPLKSGQRVHWKVRIWDDTGEVSPSPYSDASWFEMGLLNPNDWKGKWLSFLGGMIGNGMLMRYSFEIPPKEIVRARIYIGCAGYYELHMNGHKIGDKLLDPAPTDYSRTLLYSAYDVTEDLGFGRNVVGAVLGTGWAGQPKILIQLNIDFADGSRQEEFTDWGIGWCVARGPITYNSIYDGEDYDARLEKAGWDTPEYEQQFLKEHQRPGGWILATVTENPGGRLTGEILPPVRVISRTNPVFLRELPDGSHLYDAKVNQSGWVRIKVKGERGAKVTLSFAEELNEEGMLDKTALRLARCEDSYILKGDETGEEYAPRFTYHGFRYFTVKTEGQVYVETLTAEHIRSSVKENAVFSCSNEMLNQLAWVMRHTDGCNLMGIPTDCDQRDERHGWTTDTTSRAEGCTCHFDMGSFFEKWARDVYDTQDDKGYFADTAPFRWGRRPCDPQVNTPVSLVLLMYRIYGDRRLMENCYEGMMDYLRALLREAQEFLISRTGFGEWACPRGECYPEEYGAGAVSKHVSPTLVSTAYLYYSISQIREMAAILQKDDQLYLESLQRAVFEKYNERFFDPVTGQYDRGSQSADALSLALGLVPEKWRECVAGHIARDAAERGYHMTTGNMGTKALVEMLCEYGKEDVVYKIMTNTAAPGFGYMLEKGATSIWERWEADSDNNIMNSRNHPMLAAACVWFYKYLGGIRIEGSEGGICRLKIAPSAPEGLDFVKVEMDVWSGHVKTYWRRESGRMILEAEIPFNAKARIHIPRKWGTLTEAGIGQAEGSLAGNGAERRKEPAQAGMRPVKAEETEKDIIFEVGSGEYFFEIAAEAV